MRTSIIKIGNAQGIRIPKSILEQCGMQDEVEIEVQNQTIVIRPVRQVRQGWNEAFRAMALHGDDKLLDS